MIIDNTQNLIKKEKIPSIKDKSALFNLFGLENQDYEENYLKINTKNNFEIYNPEESNKKLKEIIKYVDELAEEKSTTENVSLIFLEKLFPKCEKKGFLISKSISKKLMKSKNITSETIDEKLKYFFDKRIEFRYSKKCILDKENINILGYILCYSYSKFEDFKINQKKDLTNCVKMSKKVDALNDFYCYCNDNGFSPMDCSILDFLETKNNIYLLPGEFKFLINIFDFVNTLEIDMNIEINKLEEDYDDDFYLFIITLLNMHYLSYSTTHFKVNFNNYKLQNDINDYFTKELKIIYETNNIYMKKNKELSENEKFQNKWDFVKDYIVQNKSKRFSNKEAESIIKKEKENKNENEIDTNVFPKNKNKIVLPFEKLSFTNNKNKRTGSLFIKPNFFSSSKNARAQTVVNPEIDKSVDINRLLKRTYTVAEKIKTKYDKMVDNNKAILDLIYLACLGILQIHNLKILDLFMNDCYYKEFINSFGQYYNSSKIPTSINNFHLLNNFINKLKKLQIFNIEFNSLDYITFYKILSILNKNQINTLQISFFSSLFIYSPQYIYKLYYQNTGKKEININDYYSLEYFLAHELLPFFIENLEVLFELIRIKSDNLEKLSLYFDVPEIIAINQRYLNGILKFILNILFLIDNKKSKIKKLVIISPKTILDSSSILNIEDYIDTINIEERNKNIEELSLQMQFYRIKNIKNIISTNLIVLKIGEVDIFTLKGLTKYLSSYSFFKKSSLKSLTIGILNSIINFSKEIEYLLNEIFSIKIKTLKEINIYSNLFIKDKNIFNKLFENNWISSYIFTINEKSKLIWKQKEIDEKIKQILDENNNKNKNINKMDKKVENKKLLYLIHHELEKEILNPNELALRNKKQMINTDCEVAWALRYYIIFKYSKKFKYKISYYDMKNIIFNILKFLYLTKHVKINDEIK